MRLSPRSEQPVRLHPMEISPMEIGNGSEKRCVT